MTGWKLALVACDQSSLSRYNTRSEALLVAPSTHSGGKGEQHRSHSAPLNGSPLGNPYGCSPETARCSCEIRYRILFASSEWFVTFWREKTHPIISEKPPSVFGGSQSNVKLPCDCRSTGVSYCGTAAKRNNSSPVQNIHATCLSPTSRRIN